MHKLFRNISVTINIILAIYLYNNNKHKKMNNTNDKEYTDTEYYQERMYKDYIAGYESCLRSFEVEKKLQE